MSSSSKSSLVVFAPVDEVGDCKQPRLPLALIIYFQNVIIIIIVIIVIIIITIIKIIMIINIIIIIIVSDCTCPYLELPGAWASSYTTSPMAIFPSILTLPFAGCFGGFLPLFLFFFFHFLLICSLFCLIHTTSPMATFPSILTLPYAGCFLYIFVFLFSLF